MSDAALDATADALARRALAALPEAPTQADLGALSPPLGRLLSARMNAELQRAAPASAWVDADATADARTAWLEAAQPTLRIPAAERQSVVEQATERALTHLVRPADTLAAVAFEGETGPLPTDTALARIRAFGPYPYLVQITERYVERKELSHIDRAGLERLLRRIDRRMVSAFGADEWMALLRPLLDWVGPSGRPPGTVPAGLLRALFQAKGATALGDALEEIDTVDVGTLHGLIAAALPETTAAEVGAPSTAPTPEAQATPSPAESPSSETSVPPTAPPPSTGRFTVTGEERDEDSSLHDHEATEREREPDVPASTASQTPPAERQPDPSEAGEPETLPEPPQVPKPAADGLPATETGAEAHDPPVIGSRYATAEFDEVHDSDVLGPARPLAPMEAVRDAVAEPSDIEDEVPHPPVLDIEPPTEDLPPPTAASAPDEDEPLWQRLARNREQEPTTPSPEELDEDEPLWKRFAQSDLAERLPEGATTAGALPDSSTPSAARATTPGLFLEDLEAKVLGSGAYERRDWYVAELFGGSPSEYHRTLTAIDAAASYTDATSIISSEILKKRSVSPYTDCAVAFIDAVQVQFEAR